MAETFIILRDLSRTRLAAPFEERVGPEPGLVSQPHVEVVELGKREVAELRRDPAVAALARPMPTTLPGGPEDAAAPMPEAEAAQQVTWGVQAVGAPDSPRTGSGSVVAVLDTGIDATHPAFTGMTLVEEDFTGDGTGDKNGHGTHCAGTVFGRPVDGVRIGVAPGVEKALIGKVLGNDGTGSTSDIVKGVLWALDHNADVITMSIGIDFFRYWRTLEDELEMPQFLAMSRALEAYRATLRLYDRLMRMAVAQAATGPGTVVIAATGNASHRELDPDFEVGPELPAAAEGVLGVAAVRRKQSGVLAVADFSNTFAQISGPGVGVVSARTGGGLTSKSGTSMATPHVAGAAALWWEELRARGDNARAAAVAGALLMNATQRVFDDNADDEDLGAGLVQAPR
ncbi:S8 family peptidase [Nonomuraea jiangxiensis]|uniref:Subtilase family protein n=1 Tax=Nonomuraea jiangxiensis TaxID=633440 RepID=A0A1G9JMV9_9ACTN|nr:S8 family serine peptidase [Nonomuraea jiangxiensis]SDL38900.1 Subtilase family protein [Nonomuraea jiangxiensis]